MKIPTITIPPVPVLKPGDDAIQVMFDYFINLIFGTLLPDIWTCIFGLGSILITYVAFQVLFRLLMGQSWDNYNKYNAYKRERRREEVFDTHYKVDEDNRFAKARRQNEKSGKTYDDIKYWTKGY